MDGKGFSPRTFCCHHCRSGDMFFSSSMSPLRYLFQKQYLLYSKHTHISVVIKYPKLAQQSIIYLFMIQSCGSSLNPALLLDQGSIIIRGSWEKEGHSRYKTFFESFEIKYHMPYLFDNSKISLLWIRIILGLSHSTLLSKGIEAIKQV